MKNGYKVLIFIFLIGTLFPQVDYGTEIQPIFNNYCTLCHGNAGGLNLSSYENLMAGNSNNGPVVIPYDGANSILIRKLRGTAGFGGIMPPGGPLPAPTIDIMETWIDEGALPTVVINPSLTILTPIEGAITQGNNVDVSISVDNINDGDHYHAYIDGGTVTMYYSNEFTLSNIALGSHELIVKIADVMHFEYSNPEASDTVNFILHNYSQVNYATDIQPIFDSNCTVCHGGFGGLYLTSYDDVMAGNSDHGPVVIPYDAANSILVQKLGPSPPFGNQMPFGGPYLDGLTIALIYTWIDEGALPSVNVDISIDHSAGWNMVGLPLEVEDAFPGSIFPGSLAGTLYGFDGSYNNVDTLLPGNGYWLRFEDTGLDIINGSPIDNLTINLSEDWNMISGISTSITVNSIDDPGNIIVSGTIYGFENGYVNTVTIDPGKGYWIRANADGYITIASGMTPKRPVFVNRLEQANKLNFNGITLYFGLPVPEDEKLSYSLPPKPPTSPNGFDVRFAGDWKYAEESGVIEVMNSTDPLIITYDIVNELERDGRWVLLNPNNGREYILEGVGEKIKVVDNVDKFILTKSTRSRSIPNSYALKQNYPNPFNPITTIYYYLPEQSHVNIVVYDVLGRQITRLINASQDAGSNSVVWDGIDNSGKFVGPGVYLYQIQTKDFQQTKKMILLK